MTFNSRGERSFPSLRYMPAYSIPYSLLASSFPFPLFSSILLEFGAFRFLLLHFWARRHKHFKNRLGLFLYFKKVTNPEFVSNQRFCTVSWSVCNKALSFSFSSVIVFTIKLHENGLSIFDISALETFIKELPSSPPIFRDMVVLARSFAFTAKMYAHPSRIGHWGAHNVDKSATINYRMIDRNSFRFAQKYFPISLKCSCLNESCFTWFLRIYDLHSKENQLLLCSHNKMPASCETKGSRRINLKSWLHDLLVYSREDLALLIFMET